MYCVNPINVINIYKKKEKKKKKKEKEKEIKMQN